ncbi:hypothetical protein [Thiorhodovibrio litoralis]|uniref:hypothetical protein n=1 Tax=Thiorhodovibrio litoralis TaxID=2952932 RepID=UPI002B25D4B3|nr:hypothetical protein [Thiorhodovibrio litoralis]
MAILDLTSLAPELPKKWDAADALADGWTPEKFAEAARWSDFACPPQKSEGTEGTEGTGLNNKDCSGSPSENAEGTEGVDGAQKALIAGE